MWNQEKINPTARLEPPNFRSSYNKEGLGFTSNMIQTNNFEVCYVKALKSMFVTKYMHHLLWIIWIFHFSYVIMMLKMFKSMQKAQVCMVFLLSMDQGIKTKAQNGPRFMSIKIMIYLMMCLMLIFKLINIHVKRMLRFNNFYCP